jgi:hypothetical protein
MKRRYAALVMAVVGGAVLITPAKAAPPTATPTPGYDARLQEQRAAAAREPATPVAEPVVRRRVKRIHREMH